MNEAMANHPRLLVAARRNGAVEPRSPSAGNPERNAVMSQVIVVVGPGLIGQAIARRVSTGKRVLLADLRPENAKAAADVMGNAGFDVSTAVVDVASRASIHELVETAKKLGDVTGLIHAAGVSPSQAPPATILKVDLFGTAVVLEEFWS